MRLFFALLLLFFVVPSRGQEPCFNPDLSNDGVVGSADLVLLLSYYDLTWPLDSGLSCEASISHQGHEYGVVQIGEQCWFAENCRYLPAVSLPSSMNWAPHAFVLDYAGTDVAAAMATTAYADYGVLYNWHAFTQWDLCPAGWHMATDSDWFAMEAAIGVEELELETTGFRGDNQGEQLKDSDMWNCPGEHGMGYLRGGRRRRGGGPCGTAPLHVCRRVAASKLRRRRARRRDSHLLNRRWHRMAGSRPARLHLGHRGRHAVIAIGGG